MSFERILVPVDFSEYSKAATRIAARLAIENGSELMLLNVVPSVMTGFVAVEPVFLPPRFTTVIEGERLSSAKKQLETQKQTLLKALGEALPADRIQTTVRTGSTVDTILDHAREWDASLLVMGSQGIGSGGHFLFGSASAKVSRLAPCPLLITSLDAPAATGANPFRRALVAVDYSEFSQPISLLAAEIVTVAGTLDFTHVWQPPFHSPVEKALGNDDGWQKAVSEARNIQASRLATFVGEQKLPGVVIERHVAQDSAAKGLMDRIEQTKPDVIVLGSHSRKGVTETVLGTVADRILRHATTAVLLLPANALPGAPAQ